ncbi:hypothetical protein BFN03_06965 [Rhodococcus sp. WMMA185]|nr:hypothetical protein BFN03_06965 [Rhodococcus sp. WMMA185]
MHTLAPVFGPIGADFLASFAAAQATHAASVAELSFHYDPGHRRRRRTRNATPEHAARSTAELAPRSLLDTPVADLAWPPSTTASPARAASASPNPLEELLNGAGLPALPGIDELLAPLQDLASSFGTGMFGDFDPTAILDMSSKVIDQTKYEVSGHAGAIQSVTSPRSSAPPRSGRSAWTPELTRR